MNRRSFLASLLGAPLAAKVAPPAADWLHQPAVFHKRFIVPPIIREVPYAGLEFHRIWIDEVAPFPNNAQIRALTQRDWFDERVDQLLPTQQLPKSGL